MKFRAYPGLEYYRVVALGSFVASALIFAYILSSLYEGLKIELFPLALALAVITAILPYAILFGTIIKLSDAIYCEFSLFGKVLRSTKIIDYDRVFITLTKNRICFSKTPFIDWNNTKFILIVSSISFFSLKIYTSFFGYGVAHYYSIFKFRKFLDEVFVNIKDARLDSASYGFAQKMGINIGPNIKVV